MWNYTRRAATQAEKRNQKPRRGFLSAPLGPPAFIDRVFGVILVAWFLAFSRRKEIGGVGCQAVGFLG